MSKKIDLIENTEQKIIEVATELFAKNGFEGTSTREICNAAGVNISLISYYFGGKKELYEKIVNNITQNIIKYVMKALDVQSPPENFDYLSKEEKISLLFKFLNTMIDYFYGGEVSKYCILILVKEQITNGVALNSFGYKIFKKLLASILEKDEDDKEIIFRCLSIVGQVHSARILTQFSLKMLNQEEFTKKDIQMIKRIVISQTESILKDLDGISQLEGGSEG